MANLLERSSLVLTPTAYNNGEALCIKPDDGSGDFDFSRNSAATRVNAQGLVENVQILSSNLVQNGDFSEEGVQEISNGSFSQEGVELVVGGDFSNPSDWNLSGQNLSISNGKGISTGSNFGAQFKQTILTINKTYKLVFDIVDYTSGAIGLTANYYGVQQTFNSVGTHTAYFTSLNQTELRLYSENFIGSIDNCSVREVGQDWVLGTGWSIGEDKAVATNSASGQKLRQAGQLTASKTYKLVYEITELTLGGFLPIVGAVAGTAVYSIGTYTEYITTTNDDFYIRTLGTTSGSITNISVKEVGQNWTLGTGWEIGNSVATKSGTDLSYLTQSSLTSVVGKTYNVKASITNVTTGNVRIDNFTSGTTYTSDTEVDVIYTATTAGAFRFLGWSGFDGTITNISVLEITDDTNLPRINYEGFSYQDALGSEEVVNGTFDTDSDWDLGTGWTISGGSANCDGVGFPYIRQNNVLVSGKTYLLTFDITSYTSGSIKYEDSVETPIFYNALGSYSQTFTADSNNCRFQSASFIGSIDNVSVKEVTGQEVVPDSGCGSWLFEPQSTNTILISNSVSTMNYSSNITKIDNAAISPDSTFNAMIFTPTATSGIHRAGYSTTAGLYTQNDVVTFSGFVKANGYDFITMGGFFGQEKAVFNVSNGTLVSQESNVINTEIVKLTNDWYRISTTYTFQNSIGNGYLYAGIYVMDTATGYAFTADGVSGVYGYGFQAELGTGTSYIPTEGSQVTRNQDVCSNGGSLATINSTEGVLYAEIAALANSGTTRAIYVSNGTTANRFWLEFDAAANRFEARYIANGTTSANFFHTVSDIKDFNKIAFKWKENDFSLYVNGLEVGNDTSGSAISADTLNRIDFHNQASSSVQNFFGKTKALAVWKEALSDSELQSLTTI